MSRQRTRPADLILDLLRSVDQRGHSVRYLVDAGTLFGFSENTLRVTLSRLLARGLLDNPARGRYRLARRTDPVNAFVERWRLGEARMRPWRPGRWLIAHAGEAANARDRWVLEALGFRETRSAMFARPDNLDLALSELRATSIAMGLSANCFLAAAEPEGAPVPTDWRDAWQPDALASTHADLLRRLRTSAARLATLEPRRARLESFTLGGEVIHCLAKDPLLPPELMDTAPREALWREMLDYDALGKRIWASARDAALDAMPVRTLDTIEKRTEKRDTP